MRTHPFGALALGLALFVASAHAADPTPVSVSGFRIVSADQARGMVGKAQFFDMRSAVNYGKGHVKGAAAMPYDGKSANTPDFDAGQDRFDLARLPADKNADIVFYSDGPTGWKSYKAAVQASRAGYKNVSWMREGASGWTARGFPLE